MARINPRSYALQYKRPLLAESGSSRWLSVRRGCYQDKHEISLHVLMLKAVFETGYKNIFYIPTAVNWNYVKLRALKWF